MDLQTSKFELVKLILNTKNQSLIEKVYAILKSEVKDDIPEFTEAQIKEIQQGLEQLKKGESITFKDYLKKVS
jgi:hypothetical protein